MTDLNEVEVRVVLEGHPGGSGVARALFLEASRGKNSRSALKCEETGREAEKRVN